MGLVVNHRADRQTHRLLLERLGERSHANNLSCCTKLTGYKFELNVLWFSRSINPSPLAMYWLEGVSSFLWSCLALAPRTFVIPFDEMGARDITMLEEGKSQR